MFLMFADEADREQDRGQMYFVYGAIFVDSEQAHSLHRAIQAVRDEFGYEPSDSLKFADNTRPEGITRADHREVKARVIQLAIEHNVAFCAYAMLHELARNRSHEELVQWGANTLLGKFNEYCSHTVGGHGVAFFDRMPIAHEHRYLREKFTVGLTFPNGRTRRLDRIIALASTCDNASHLSSVTDIVLGSFRYCVNEPERDIAGRAMFPSLVELMWKRRRRESYIVLDYGLVLRPTEVQAVVHQEQYTQLIDRLQGYLA